MDLNCHVCTNKYDNGKSFPHILRCGHTFCIECLRKLESERGFFTSPKCPICSKSFSYPSDLTKNFEILSLNSQSSQSTTDNIIDFHSTNEITIFLKNMNNRNIPYKVKESCLVKDLKKLILEGEGLEIEHQRLIFGGKSLQDENTLSSYGIKERSTINLVKRLKGGTFIMSKMPN